MYAAIVFVFCGVMLMASPQAEEIAPLEETPKKLHGYVPIVFYEGGFYPVVGVKKNKPLIDVEGELVSVKKDGKVFFWASDTDVSPTIKTGRFVSSFVRSTHARGDITGSRVPMGINGRIVRRGTDSSGQPVYVSAVPRTTILKEEVRWERILRTNGILLNAFGVFIVYSDEGVAGLHWRNLKNRSEGEKLSVKVPNLRSRSFKTRTPPAGYLLLVFQDGEELVPSDHPDRVDLLKWFEALSMAELSDVYVQKTQEKEVDPVRIYKTDFDLSKSDYKVLEGKEFFVNVMVNKLGIVSEASLEADIPESISNEILDSVQLWKFFPAIRKGKLAEQEVVIPLQF
jgi:hypothetical protein